MASMMKVCFFLCFLPVVHGNVDVKLNTLYPSDKIYWAKQITPDIYTAGRLSEPDIKFIAEEGFKSLVSVKYFPESSTVGEEILPSSEEEKLIVEKFTSLDFVQLNVPGDGVNMEYLENFTRAMDSMEKPVLVHCVKAGAATLSVLLYLANRTRYDSEAEPQVTSETFFEIGSSWGYNYANEHTLNFLSQITNESKVENPAEPDFTPTDWRTYWWAKPVYKSWSVAGQVQTNHLQLIKDAGFEVVINSRKGALLDGDPNQEPVNLLNIKNPPADRDDQDRQLKEKLEENILDTSKPNMYISENSTVNYQAMNAMLFGDVIGYNETRERLAMEEAGIEYVHLPIDMFRVEDDVNSYLDQLEEYKDKKVLFHCTVGYRAIVLALTAIRQQYGLSGEWALNRAKEIGYHFEEIGDNSSIAALSQTFETETTTTTKAPPSGVARNYPLSIAFLLILTVMIIWK